MLLDTPGVIPYMDKDDLKQCIIGTINFDKVKHPEYVVMELIEKMPGIIEEYYGIPKYDEKKQKERDSEMILEEIAVMKNKLRKGGVPDTETVAKLILKDWQQGKIIL